MEATVCITVVGARLQPLIKALLYNIVYGSLDHQTRTKSHNNATLTVIVHFFFCALAIFAVQHTNLVLIGHLKEISNG